ncbi:MAG: hypothetical protein U0996_25580 [Planctomycetaceae bacterium]
MLLQDLPQPEVKRAARSNGLRFSLAPSLLVNGEMPNIINPEGGRRQLVLNCRPGNFSEA